MSSGGLDKFLGLERGLIGEGDELRGWAKKNIWHSKSRLQYNYLVKQLKKKSYLFYSYHIYNHINHIYHIYSTSNIR